MENPSSPSAPTRRSRFFRIIGRVLIGLAALVTLTALFYAEEDWRGKYAWENYRRDAAARGVNLDWKQFIPAPVPDDQNFATTPFLAPLLDLNPRPFTNGMWRDSNAVFRAQNFADDFMKKLYSTQKDPSPLGFVGQMTDLEGLAAALQKNSTNAAQPAPINTRSEAASYLLQNMSQYQPVLDELRTASQRPYSRFNVHYDDEDPAGILLPHLAVLRRVSQLLRIRASAELALGMADPASEDVRMMFRLAEAIHTEPILISQLVRFAVLNSTRQVIWEGLAQHRWSDAQLAGFETSLRELSLIKDARWGLESERTGFGVNLYDYFRKNPRFLLDAVANSPENPGEPQGDIVALTFAPSGWLYQEQISHQKFFDDKLMSVFSPDASQVHPRTVDELLTHFPEHERGSLSGLLQHRVLLRLLVPSLGKIAQKAAVAQAGIDETLIACALERHHLANGNYPDTLTALVPKYLDHVPIDVCNGQPMKYRRSDDGQFVLYSVGWNEKDDGGTVVMKQSDPSGKDILTKVMNQDKTPGIDILQGDWVWPAYPAK
jgi:hypothetical protein